MSNPLGPEDRLPRQTPVYPEPGGTRWELPVTVAGTAGVLVVRTFDAPRTNPVTGEVYDCEISVRGRAVLLLDAQRRNRR